MAPQVVRRLLTILVLGFLASPWTCSIVSAQAQSRRNVLAIHWGPEDHPANLVMDRAIREVLGSQSDGQLDYFAEYLEASRSEPTGSALALVDYMREKYRGRRFDLVIATTDSSLQFVLDHRLALFPAVPIVFAGFTAAEAMARVGRSGFAAVIRGPTYAKTLTLALELHPSTERVFVVAASPRERIRNAVQTELQGFSRRVTLTYVHEPTVARLLATVKAVPPRSLILYIWHAQKDLPTLLFEDEIARRVARASPVPTYGTSDLYIGSGVVGGVMRSTRATGTRLGEMARQILSGTRPQDIPIEMAQLVATLDWRQLQRWGIDPSRLPSGSDVQFRVPTAWESYWWYIVGTLIAIAAQLLLIAGLLTQRARRHRAEEAVRIREATLRTSYERNRHLAGRLITAQEAARAQIARDLHDDVCQDLVGVSMEVTSLQRSSGRIQDGPAQQSLSRLKQQALVVVDAVRQLSHDLHPASLRLVGLASALKTHCIEVERRHDVQVAFSAQGDLEHVDPDVALCVFRIAQEAQRNGAVHGRARRLTVSIARSGEEIELTVRDDGQGFDLEAVRRAGSGLGLVSMEERAHVVGGDVHIVSGPHQGTIVCVRVPAGVPAKAQDDSPGVHVRRFAHLSPRN